MSPTPQPPPSNAAPSLRPRPARPTPLRPAAAPSLPPRRAPTLARGGVAVGQPPVDPPLKRALKGALLVGVAAGSAFGVVRIADAVENSARLPLRTVAVSALVDGENEAPPLSEERAGEVRAYADLKEGEPWLAIDLNEVSARVERHPYVREARVERRPPDALAIHVALRAPAAVLRKADALYFIDADGDVMKQLRPGEHVDAPVITLVDSNDDDAALPGLSTATAIIAAAEAAGLGPRISEVVGVAGGGFDVVIDASGGAARVRLGETDFPAKLRRLASVEQRLKEKGQSFSFMWLDDAQRPERVAVRLRPSTETSATGG